MGKLRPWLVVLGLTVLLTSALLVMTLASPVSSLPFTSLRGAQAVRKVSGFVGFPKTQRRFTATVYHMTGDWTELRDRFWKELSRKGWHESANGAGPSWQEFQNDEAGCELIDGKVGDFELADRGVYWSQATWRRADGIVSIVVTLPDDESIGLVARLRKWIGLD
jgi:hypothetical protein